MAMTERSMVIGVFRDRALAEQAIGELKHVGFRDDQIHFLGRNSGGALGGLKSIFSGRDTTTGDTPDELTNAGVAQEDIPFYTREIEAGHAVIMVESYGRQQEAENILYRFGAYDASADTSRMGGGNRVIPIREERLDVHKQVVQTGEVRIHKRIITENKTFTVPVTREEVIIERLPATGSPGESQFDAQAVSTGSTVGSQPALDRSGTSFEEDTTTKLRSNPNQTNADMVDGGEMLRNGGTIRILVREEQVVINKQPVVVEEIVVHKQQIQENRQIADTVKHEEVRVERAGDVIVHSSGVDEAV